MSLHCGLDMSEYDGPRTRPPQEGIDLITVGRLEREKGHALFLEALATLREPEHTRRANSHRRRL